MIEVEVHAQRGAFRLDVRISAPTPGVIALFGRSGCGKTTLVNAIAGLIEGVRGRVSLEGEVVLDTENGIRVPVERRRIGYVFQDSRLFPHLRVEANLRYGEKRARGAHFVDLDTVTDLLGLRPLLRRRTHELSGGERQRVAIGRALLSQPRLLLLDEPLASLDAARRDEVLPYLESLRDRLAIPMVYVTHNFEELLRLASHVVLLESGRSVAEGDVGGMSWHPGMRALVGADAVGAVVEGRAAGVDAASGLTRIRVAGGELKVRAPELPDGARIRVQLLARDLIVATEPPQRTSVRNMLAGTVRTVTGDGDDADLIGIDLRGPDEAAAKMGGAEVVARVTKISTRELGLKPGLPVWVLVKSVSLRGHTYASPQRPAPR